MPLMFNTLLEQAGFNLEDVRLVRHKDKRAAKGRTPFELWSNKLTRPQFELYQSVQAFKRRRILNARYWAVFAKLSIEWGPGYRAWAQYASGNDKRVTKSRQESKKSNRPRSDESPLR